MKLINGTQETKFEYDGLDRRVRIIEKQNGVEQSNQVYLWDRTEIVQRRDSAGSTVERNYFASGFDVSGNDYYYTKDHLGSIREVVASDGTTVESVYDYSPWGEVERIGGAGVESDFLYTGHFYHEPSDLHLTLYRAYNPELGMWLSRDPIELIYGISAELLHEGPNLYAYASNNPTNNWDAFGLDVRFENTPQVGGLHQRVAVDAGSGSFYGQSFGTTGGTDCSSKASSAGDPTETGNGQGMVYEDSRDPSTKVQETLKTTPTQDEKIKEWLRKDIGNKAPYHPLWNSCRHYSKSKFKQIKKKLKNGDFGK